jgi:hypothetical protein
MVTLNEGFRTAVNRFIEAPEEKKLQEFAELANLVEIACAIHVEGSLFGVSRELSRNYTERLLELLERDEASLARLEVLINQPDTFKYIAKFYKEIRKNAQL